MLKLPISKSSLNYYHEIGYKFSFKEQAHFCYRDTPELLKRISILKELIEISDDEKLNNDVKAMIDYEHEVYSKFMQNDDNKYVYVLRINEYDGRVSTSYFGTAQQALDYNYIRSSYVSQINEIDKAVIMYDCDEMKNGIPATVKVNSSSEIIDYRSVEYDDDYEFDEPFEARFYQMFMNIDCPFERGDIVKLSDDSYPLIVLSDRDIFHKKYDAHLAQYDNALDMLEYDDNCIPVLNCVGEFKIDYVRPFKLEKVEQTNIRSRTYWDAIIETSKMVKARYNIDKIKKMGRMG